MNKTELIDKIAAGSGLSKADSKKALDATVAAIKEALVKGDKVLVFHKKRRKGYRKLNGHRQQFSEVLVKEIVA